MRRESDIRDAERTGVGRRQRDKLLSGQVQPLPAAVSGRSRGAERHRMHFVADELREAALATAGIEAFLERVHQLLDRGDASAVELRELLGGADLDGRVGALDDALAALVRSIQSVIGASTLDVNNA